MTFDPTGLADRGADQLFQAGTVGVFCVLFIVIGLFLWRELLRQRDKYEQQLTALQKEYAAKVDDLYKQMLILQRTGFDVIESNKDALDKLTVSIQEMKQPRARS